MQRINRYPCRGSLLLLLLALLSACAGDTVHFEISDLPKPVVPNDTTTYGTLYFSAFSTPTNAIDSKAFLQPDDTIPLPKGRIVSIFIYDGNTTPETGQYVYYGKYTVNTPGYLTPIYNDPQLPVGQYNLYGVSELINSSDKTPAFNNGTGIATDLYNGLDYLWWSQLNISVVDTTPQSIPILFEHVATRIEIEFTPPDDCVIDTIYQATLAYPNTDSCTYQLATGQISPATSVSLGSFDMNMNGNLGFINYVPLDGDDATLEEGVSGLVDIMICGEYLGYQEFFIPMPGNNKFEAGNSYQYEVEFPMAGGVSSAKKVLKGVLKGVKRISDLPGQK